MLRRRVAARLGLPDSGAARQSRSWNPIIPWLFLLPGLLMAFVFKFVPLGQSVVFSFQDVQPFLGNEFVGLDNYADLAGDEGFREALGHTLTIAIAQTVGALVLGLVLAMVLEGSGTVLSLVRTATFLPVVTAVAVVAEVWRLLMFPDEFGFVNSMLGLVGIGPQEFLNDPDTALWWVIVVCIWSLAPYNMVILLAGLAGVDRSLYEAAAIDGVSTWQRIRYITLPQIRPAITIVLILASIRSLRIFTEVFVLTGGGPAGSTQVWLTRTFEVGTIGNDVGLASAASILLLVVTAVLTLGTRALSNRKEA